MFSSEDLEKIKQKISQLQKNSKKGQNVRKKDKLSNEEDETNDFGISLNPSEILVIAGIMGGVLEVSSISLTRDQGVEICLSGSLKRQTDLEKTMKEIGELPFEEVIKAILTNTGR